MKKSFEFDLTGNQDQVVSEHEQSTENIDVGTSKITGN